MKLFAIDLDGTLLNEEAKISKQYEQIGHTRIPSYEDIPLDVEIYNVLCFSFDQAKLNRGRERYRDYTG